MSLPERFPDRDEIASVRAEAELLGPGGEADDKRRVAGRVLARREMGKLVFLDDVDLGDIVGVTGSPARAKRGEPSIVVDELELLAKIQRPLPDTFHGVTDVEPRYGGGFAEPFVTHYNALDADYYLRIATELYLKRLIVGGLEKVYELGKDFRNEGLSYKHVPEFTMLEWYEAYTDYRDNARRLEELVSGVADAVGYAGEVSFAAPWRRLTLRDAIRDETGIDVIEHRE